MSYNIFDYKMSESEVSDGNNIRYAYVLFTNGVKKTVSISSIPQFFPKSRKDFDKQRKVKVWWLGNGGSKDSLYNANILVLGTSKQDVEDQKKCSRIKFPNKRNMSFSSAGSEVQQKTSRKKITKTQKKKNLPSAEAKQLQNENILNRHNILLNRRRIIISDSSSDSEHDSGDTIRLTGSFSDGSGNVPTPSRNVRRNLFTPNRRVLQDIGNNNDFDDRYDTHHSSNISQNHYTHLQNSRPLDRLTQRDLNVPAQIPLNLMPYNQHVRNVLDTDNETNEKVHLGLNVYVDRAIWYTALDKDPPKFVRDVMEMIWDKETLKTRCLQPSKANRNRPRDSQLQQLTPEKYQLLKDCLRKKLIDEKVPVKTRVKRMRIWKTVSSKLYEIRSKKD